MTPGTAGLGRVKIQILVMFHTRGMFYALVGKTGSAFPKDSNSASEILIALELV